MGGPGPAIRLERLVQRAEGVQQVALAVGIEQGPSLVLAVDVDHLLAQALKSRDRHGHPVDLGGAAALRGDSSRDDQRVLVEHPAEDCFELSAQRLVLDFEDCRSPGLRLARADQVGRGLPSKNQPERREQQALPRPGLPRPAQNPPSSSTCTSSISARFCTESSRNTTKGPPNACRNRSDRGLSAQSPTGSCLSSYDSWASRPNPRRVENRPATHPLYGVIS